MDSILDTTIARLLLSITPAWRRVNSKESDEPTEEAISLLCARGLLEVRIVAVVEMADQKMPKCRYIGGGAWWTLLEKELDRLVPATWLGKDGKPKHNLLQRASVVAVRLTADGADYRQAVKSNTREKWIGSRPKKITAYLRCDGIDRRAATPRNRVQWSKADSPSRWAKLFKISTRTFVRHVARGKIAAKKLSDKSYQVDINALPADHK